ncbi:Serine incorporator 1, partial [Xenotaenia resolanae]
WYYFGVVGSFIFIIIQLILLVDFAHSWNQSWLEKAENGNTRCWFAALLSFTFITYALAFTAVVLFYVFYTQPDDCTEHKVFISLNLLFCIAVSIVAILPKVQVMVMSLKCLNRNAPMTAFPLIQVIRDLKSVDAEPHFSDSVFL